jgi:FAD/FMN-containing dehydrogenase/Fe-S oxidoreductase
VKDSSDLERALAERLQGEVRFDPLARRLYATDASIYEMEPAGVVMPRSTEDVVHAVRLAAEHGASILPRGGGTSLAGQTVGHSLQLDLSRHMTRILEVDPQGHWARVQPGVVLDELNARLSGDGLMFGPDVSTSSRANLGGMIGNNSCGAHSIVYGKTIDHVIDLTVVLADGTVTTLAPVAEGDLAERRTRPGLEGAAYAGVEAVLHDFSDDIDAGFPKVMRRVSGYNLDALRPPAPFDLSRLIVGSEGTLCTVVEARVRLVDKPKHTAVVACHFHDLIESMEANILAVETQPAASELMDRVLMDQTRGQLEYEPRRRFLDGDPDALLCVEYSGDSEAEVRQRCDDLEATLRGAGLGYAYVRGETAAQQKDIWDLRKAGLGLLMGMRGDPKPTSGVEDTCVPVPHLPEYVRKVRDLMGDLGVETATFYGHASVGVLHIRPVLDLKQKRGIETLRTLEEHMSDWVLEYGGSMSAEHGDGLARSEWIEKMFGPRLVEAFARVKAAFDPDNVMNPGKIVDAPPMDANLRYGEGYPETPVETFFRYDEAGGFQQAVEMCSGVGQCRKKLVGTMCPSYMATLDEEHSTRGRANALRAALNGTLPGGLQGEALHEAMDLCLECKACKAECPSSVDMAKLKYEFLAAWHGRHGYPLRSHLFARIDTINRWLSPVAGLANAVMRTGLNRWLLERVAGIDRRRQMPALASQRFSRWFAARPEAPATAGTVVFYNDTFTEYNEPEIGQAAVRLLEAAGYRVVLPEQRRCCGRPMISKGFLDDARQRAGENIAALLPYAEKGWPIVGVEPSCLLAYRDDYLDLAPDAEAARRLAEHVFLLEEFLARRLDDDARAITFEATPRRVLFHGHCHQKALIGTASTMRLLRAPAGYDVSEIASGCCGMAGSFGYEHEHYEVSMQVGKPRLFDALADADPDVEVATAGTSCRHQIADGTGRSARHWACVLADALPPGP